MAKRKKNKLREALNEVAQDASVGDESAAEESKEKPIDIPDEEVVQIFQEVHAEADEAYQPIKAVSDIALSAYNNDFDFSDKEDFQSQSFLPIYKNAIRVAKSVVRRSLLEAPKYFDVEGLNDESKALQQDVFDGLYRIAEQAEFRENVAKAAFGGFLENLGVLKIFPAPMQEEDEPIHLQQTVKIVCDPVSVPNDFRLDPKGRGLYVLHRSEMDFPDFESLVESGEYEKSSLEFAKQDFAAKEEEYRKAMQEGQIQVPKPSWRKTVELWEVWMRAISRKDGTTAARDAMFTIINRKNVARRPRKYLYKHNKPPFVWSPVADKPFSVYHENFGEPVLGMLDAILDLMNSLVDAAENVATKAVEINVNDIRNPSELGRGLYGGKVFKTSKPPIPGLETVRTFDAGEFSPEAMHFLSWMVQQFQGGIGITDLISGIPGVGQSTATEITQKTRAAMGNLSEVTGLLDKYLVGPSLNMMYRLMLEWNPEVFGERLAFRTDRKKLKFKFHISGISGAMKADGDFQEFMMLVKVLMGTPLATRLNWDNIGKEMFKRKGFKPEQFLASQAAVSPVPGEGPTATDMESEAAAAPMIQRIMGGMK